MLPLAIIAGFWNLWDALRDLVVALRRVSSLPKPATYPVMECPHCKLRMSVALWEQVLLWHCQRCGGWLSEYTLR